MSFGSTPDTLLYEVFFGLGALASIGLLALLGALIQRIFRIKVDYFTLIFMVVVGVGTTLGLSLYLDTAGQRAAATITKKMETIHYRAEGDWQHNYEVWASYQLADGSAPSAHFTTTPTYFDTLQEGGQVTVRSVSINNWFNLARFADQSTWTWIPWRWLGIGGSVILLGIISWRLLKRRGGWLPLVIILLVLATIPFVRKYAEWRAAIDPSRTPLHASGVIQEVEEVTTIDPMPGDGSGDEEWDTSIEVAQRYAIVVVRYAPQGYGAPILGVDAVDIGDNSQPLVVDRAVEITYAANEPRTVRLADRMREHHIRNPLEWIKQQLFALGLGAALLLLISWIGNRWQRFLDKRHAEALSRNARVS